MNIEVKEQKIAWGALDVALFGITKDWYGKPLEKPAAFGLAVDPDYLWFVAAHQRPATIHPDARPGEFQLGLFDYDVAEFFLADPESGNYFEFNLAPNGAWWSCEFAGVRERVVYEGMPVEGVATYADLSPDGSWLAAAAVPLHYLKSKFNFGDASKMNVCFILESPKAKFLSAASIDCEEPNYHVPESFSKVTFFKQ